MEAHLGRHLEQSEIVHHRNHDKLDNRLENLEYHESVSSHMKHHGWQKGQPKPWAQKAAVPCPVCGDSFRPKRRTLPGGIQADTKTCSPSCGQRLRYS